MWVWETKAKPRAIARVEAGTLALAPPAGGELVLLAGDTDNLALRTLSLKPSAAASSLLDVSGWRAAPLPLRLLAELPSCTPKSRGSRFSLRPGVDGRVEAPGWTPDAIARASFAVRVADDTACIEALTVFGGLAGPTLGVDLVKHSAQGLGPSGQLVDLSCALSRR